ncbi:hypothetical protein [Alcanivorax sp. P2S70]|uniref:hypothetical protein n=1 Tax=Alcanivorax sp. P2S70 TaxID=1397527 RepID=UPI0004CEA6A1|nr:hypothetical protein [Alcanivorax sp. P2S70]
MVELTTFDDQQGPWYPTSVHRLETYLGKLIEQGHGYVHVYQLKKDLAYNLQYMEFQDRVIQDIKLSSVLYTQSIKTIVLVGCSIIESILHFLILKNGHHTSIEWEEKITFKGNQKKLDGEDVRVDTVIYRKLPEKRLKHMTFDAMIKCAKSHRLFGSSKIIYEKLESMRKLRNRIHLQVTDDRPGTDWTTFDARNIDDAYLVLYSIMVSSLFSPNSEEKGYFSYLRGRFSP